LIGQENNAWGMYGGTYGSSSGGSISFRPQIDYWGLKNEIKRKDGPHFNYFELGPGEENSVYNRYGGPMPGHGGHERPPPYGHHQSHQSHQPNGMMNWGQMWTRRPGSEGELKRVVKNQKLILNLIRMLGEDKRRFPSP
jgi:hypothetical protein